MKRPRKANFSPAECSVYYIKYVRKKPFYNWRKVFKRFTKQKKAEVWKKIVQQVNSFGAAKRTVTEVKDKWRSMVMGAKKDYSRDKQGRKKTGGGQQPAPPSSQSTRIINLFRD